MPQGSVRAAATRRVIMLPSTALTMRPITRAAATAVAAHSTYAATTAQIRAAGAAITAIIVVATTVTAAVAEVFGSFNAAR